MLPEAGEYERTSTTAVNAYVLPALARLPRAAGGRAARARRRRRRSSIGNSNGGLARSGGGAGEAGLLHLLRAASSGAVGARAAGRRPIGEADLVAFDMGGTTASAALIHQGELARTHEYEFRAGISMPARFIKAGGYMMRVPTVDVAEVGNGAGSIAAIDAARAC